MPLRLGVLGLLVMACDILGPTPVCACSPIGGWAAITGRVVTASDAAAPGAVVTLQLLADAPCENVTPSSLQVRMATAGDDGRFRLIEAWSGGNKCFRLFARPAGAATGATSDTQVVNIQYGVTGAVPDSVELLLRLK